MESCSKYFTRNHTGTRVGKPTSQLQALGCVFSQAKILEGRKFKWLLPTLKTAQVLTSILDLGYPKYPIPVWDIGYGNPISQTGLRNCIFNRLFWVILLSSQVWKLLLWREKYQANIDTVGNLSGDSKAGLQNTQGPCGQESALWFNAPHTFPTLPEIKTLPFFQIYSRRCFYRLLQQKTMGFFLIVGKSLK